MKKIFYLLPLMALASCTSNDIVENPAPVYGTEEIQLNGGIITSEAAPLSRAILTDVPTGGMNISILRQDADPTAGTLPTDFSTFSANDLKTAFVYGQPASGASAPAKGTVVFGTSASVSHEYYLANGKDTRLFLWYPQTTATPLTDVTYANGVVTFNNLNGYVDVMASKAVTGNKSTKITTAIELKHMLSQLQFKAYEGAADEKKRWGKITKIEILSVEPTCAVTLKVDGSEPTIGYSGTAANLTVKKADGTAIGDVEMAAFDTDEATTKAAATDCGAILIPTRLANATKMKIKVYTEKYTDGKEVELNNTSAYESSKSNIVYLKFTSEEILPTVTISAWVAGTNQDITM